MNKEEFLSTYKTYGDDLILELIDTFLEDYPLKLSALSEAIQNKDFANIANNSHNIKGSLGVFAAYEEQNTAYNLELAGKNKDDSDLEKLLSQFKQQLNDLSNELQNIKSELSQSSEIS